MKITIWSSGILSLVVLLASCGHDSSSEVTTDDDPTDDDSTDDDSTDDDDDTDTELSIEDDALEDCVRNAINMSEGGIFPEDVSDLTHLSCIDMGIEKLDGLEAFLSLESLYLWENAIDDINPIAGLTELNSLQLGNNQVVDVTPLTELSKLTRLGLSLNSIDDVESLANLSSVTWLNLDHNLLDEGDIEFLCDLSELNWLTVEYNYIEDTSVLECFEFDDVYYGHQNTSQNSVANTESSKWKRELRSTKYPGIDNIDFFVPQISPVQANGAKSKASVPGIRNTELLDYVLASPNQMNAGSCLFMANTGTMELLLNQHIPIEDIEYQGDTDLSERYLMNALDHIGMGDIDPAEYYFYTDIFYLYELFGGSLLDRDYPFVCGYYTLDGIDPIPSDPSNPDAIFGCYYSWFDELPKDWQDTLTPTPNAERTLIALDPDLNNESIWNVGLMDRDVVERIKNELDSKHSPMIIIYNHFGYWHANSIVGYDDEIYSDGCPMVEDSLEFFENQGAKEFVAKIEQHMKEQGGCSDYGMFYVRDSIYAGGKEEPMYTYSEEYDYVDKYSMRIVQISYNWVVYLANHAYTVHRRQ